MTKGLQLFLQKYLAEAVILNFVIGCFMMRAIALLPLFITALPIVQGFNCTNRSNSVVVRGVQRNCTWVGEDRRRCTVRIAGGGTARSVCVVQCNEKCRVPKTTLQPAFNPSVIPIQKPTSTPKSNPTAPSIPKPTSTITSKPSVAPVHKSTSIPTLPPVLVIPVGPYITANTSSERVVIPRPPVPDLTSASYSCPHLEAGLHRWNDASTWAGGKLPANGENVRIPVGYRVLVDQSVFEKLGVIEIPKTSALIFGRNASGIKFEARGIIVFGSLIAGSETCKISTPITITLHGPRPLDILSKPPSTSYKGIVVTGGTLSLHGARFYHTWTRLAKTVYPGENIILLQEPVNWMAGQKIVLVTSAMKDSRDFNQNEVLTIEKVIGDAKQYGIGAIIYVTSAVVYQHIANKQYQVEVGLLTRFIKIQGGADDSEPVDKEDRSCMDPWSTRSHSIYFNTTQPCMDKHRTGFGGHVRIEAGSIAQVEGVELYRMGQTNVMGRYPMHFHLLGECPTCYFKFSSVHRSFYRCISIHGTHSSMTTENVAYDIIGFCYYLEDGIEQSNTISYNLVSHVHMIGPSIPRVEGHRMSVVVEGENLTLPADVSASGFYITNVNNTIVGNAASGGWAGFAFPLLPRALQTFTLSTNYSPAAASGHKIDGNTAHSTGWWWKFGSGFYVGGDLYYDDKGTPFVGGNSTFNQTGKLTYDAGRGASLNRNPCQILPFTCKNGIYCNQCFNSERRWLRLTNSKSFLIAGTGMNSWTGRLELIGFEAHDVSLSLNALSNDGFFLSNSLVVCRTGENLGLQRASLLEGNGIVWYDTGQSHILTNVTYRNCGFRSANFSQYSVGGGCDSNNINGCHHASSVFSSLTQSDEFIPEIMQATKGINFENCGRRLRVSSLSDSASSRSQAWIDEDGSISQLGHSSLIASGLDSVKGWWGVDAKVVYEPQGPHRLINMKLGPQRGLGYFHLGFDPSIQDPPMSQNSCSGNMPCAAQGYIRHAGRMFSSTLGMPIISRGEITGPIGGYGWIISFVNKTVPRVLKFNSPAIDARSRMTISIPYPKGTIFQVIAVVGHGCPLRSTTIRCNETFTQVPTLADFRNGTGNTYHIDDDGVLTFRMAQTAMSSIPIPFKLPDYNSAPSRVDELWAIQRFERDGIILPQRHNLNSYSIVAKCPSDVGWIGNGYCSETVGNPNDPNWRYDPDVCPVGYEQVAYDGCCLKSDLSKCQYADGSRNF